MGSVRTPGPAEAIILGKPPGETRGARARCLTCRQGYTFISCESRTRVREHGWMEQPEFIKWVSFNPAPNSFLFLLLCFIAAAAPNNWVPNI